MTEKKPRLHNRYNIQTAARIKKMGGNAWIEVKVISLSGMGACFASSGHLGMSDLIEFYMPSPGDAKAPFHLSAKVVWVRDGQVGIEFTGKLAAG